MGRFNVKTDDPPRAGLTELAGRIWPAGRTLPTPGINDVEIVHNSISFLDLPMPEFLLTSMILIQKYSINSRGAVGVEGGHKAQKHRPLSHSIVPHNSCMVHL